MKSPSKLLLLAGIVGLAVSFTVPAFAEDAAAPAKKEHKVSKKDLEKYDANKDGKLDEQEMAVRKADKKAQREAKKAKAAAEKSATEK